MCACVSIIKNSMPAENDETLVESQNFMELSSKKKKSVWERNRNWQEKKKDVSGDWGDSWILPRFNYLGSIQL